MAIDMSQFHQVFFEECFEGLEAMESGLLTLDTGNIDSEIINTIFRGAHSIKGGSGTFGFTVVADYTHIMETLLDEMRDGRRQVTHPAVAVLLGSVDCLREMLTAIQNEQVVNNTSVSKHKKALESVLNGESSIEITEEVVTVKMSEKPSIDSCMAGWKIAFCPYLDLLKTGNDPVRLFRELNELGKITVIPNIQDIPGFYEIDPEECNISWDIQAVGSIQENEIKEIFSWVEGDCELEIEPLVKSVVKKINPEPSTVLDNPTQKSAEAKPKTETKKQKVLKKLQQNPAQFVLIPIKSMI